MINCGQFKFHSQITPVTRHININSTSPDRFQTEPLGSILQQCSRPVVAGAQAYQSSAMHQTRITEGLLAAPRLPVQSLPLQHAPLRTHRRHVCIHTSAQPARDAPREPSEGVSPSPLVQGAWEREEPVPTAAYLRNSAQTHWLGRVWRAIPRASIREFLIECWHTARRLSAPSPGDAINRLGLILVTSLVMIVVVTTIDSTCLWLYVAGARKLA